MSFYHLALIPTCSLDSSAPLEHGRPLRGGGANATNSHSTGAFITRFWTQGRCSRIFCIHCSFYRFTPPRTLLLLRSTITSALIFSFILLLSQLFIKICSIGCSNLSSQNRWRLFWWIDIRFLILVFPYQFNSPILHPKILYLLSNQRNKLLSATMAFNRCLGSWEFPE